MSEYYENKSQWKKTSKVSKFIIVFPVYIYIYIYHSGPSLYCFLPVTIFKIGSVGGPKGRTYLQSFCF